MTPRDGKDKQSRDLSQQAVAALIRASLEGDHDAYRQLVERKRDLVFRVAHNQLGNVEDARIVSQDVFVRVWKNLGSYDATRPFDSWLCQIALNAAIDHHRRRKARPPETEFDETLHARSAEPDPVQAEQLGRILRAALSLLPERQRMAFVLREVEGLPTNEVASALGTTESTVRNHVFQARKLLREEIARRYPELVPHAKRLLAADDESASGARQ